ncbi:MAG: hypothetical protein E7163_01955 [Firmicutes bacterium]|nr:hypothetical protein [Bacillota bacterium]
MHESEVYYRRCFNLINELYNLYISGYNYSNIINYSNNRRRNLNQISSKENYAFLFASLISLMGINKEAIEETGKNTNYLNYIDSSSNDENSKQLLAELARRRLIITGLDDWLAVTNNLDNNTSNMSYLKKVRNALLHSHFDTSEYFFTKVWNNNKSMFEGYLCNANFFQFVISYFSNIARMGLKDNCFIYMAPKDLKINNYNELVEALDKFSIKSFKYSLNKNYNGYNSIEYQLQKICLINEELREDKFKKLWKKFKNLGIEVDGIEELTLNNDIKNIISTYILNYYGDNFYKVDGNKQKSIIISLCEYIYDNHSLISNWILHFIYVVSNDGINKKYFLDDDLISFVSIPSLLIIKAYHVLYRLQCDDFQEIDYNLIDFDFNKDDFYSFVQDKNVHLASSFLDSFNKLKLERTDLSDNEIKNKVICDIIRDALAHGNIRTCFAVNNGVIEHIIEFDDIYRGKTRGIQMTIEKFARFLNSQAFLPKYALVKNNGHLLK